ncbi:MAG: hypothetical protein IJF67_06985, partial [Clostridia bacterium]|nr:hypothetical protein [Clostridia bacterium]
FGEADFRMGHPRLEAVFPLPAGIREVIAVAVAEERAAPDILAVLGENAVLRDGKEALLKAFHALTSFSA